MVSASHEHDMPAIMRAIISGYRLPLLGYHGVIHWARVFENGQRIAELHGADRDVVGLFAVFHDARRINESRDDGHGLRGAELARSLRGTLIHLEDERFDALFEACRLHTNGLTTGDPTLQACWDADRLDLGRVGITPRRDRLCTDAARGLLSWANDRAITDYNPRDVLSEWAIDTSP